MHIIKYIGLVKFEFQIFWIAILPKKKKNWIGRAVEGTCMISNN